MSKRNAGVEFRIEWASEMARHSDRLYVPRTDLRRDLFPGDLAPALASLAVGEETLRHFAAGELVPGYDEDQVLAIPEERFNRRFAQLEVEPRAGRYYPRGMIAGVAGISAREYGPFRVLARTDQRLEVDLNHPLARYALDIGATLVEVLEPPGPRFGGAGNDIGDALTSKGPGLQALGAGLRTDFFHDYPFRRLDDNPDSFFYRMPRLVAHVDAVASREIGRLYARLLQPGWRVLDLMSSWISHLPASLEIELSGLGLNEEELSANARLSDYVLKDLNREPRLPYDEAVFDAVICANSVEYLTRPLEVFAEVARVLKPGGLFVNVFSERWFPPKVISLWSQMHPFERMGLVLESLCATGAFANYRTESLRGYPRPDDDKYRDAIPRADPVYAVWASRLD